MELYKENQLKIYNSLTKSKELFKPVHEGHIGMYVCGPTVYSNAHLGNLRTFMFFDVAFRYFTHLGYKVRYVRNITDAGHLENDADEGEDRISKKARLEQIVHQIDRLEMALQAKLYQKSGSSEEDIATFLETAKSDIFHPKLQQLFRKIIEDN